MATIDEPDRGARYLVFAQRSSARIELDAWKRHAATFFATRLGLTRDVRYGEDDAPRTESVDVVIAFGDESGVRKLIGRMREPRDLDDADEAEGRGDRGGLADLARRCDAVWMVATEGEDDRVALRIAAILAGGLLGPIVAPRNARLFGPKTARAMLESPHP